MVRENINRFGILSLGLFLCSQAFKVPIKNTFGFDATLILFLFVVIISLINFVTIEKKKLYYIGLLLSMPMMVLISLLFSSLLFTDYQATKVLHYFTLTLAAIISPILLLNKIEDLKFFVYSLLYISFFVALLSLFSASSNADVFNRYQDLSANPIITSRVASIAFLVSGMLFINNKIKLLYFLVIVLVTAYVMLVGASRGPLYTSVFLLISYNLINPKKYRYLFFVLLVVIVGYICLDFIVDMLPYRSLDRLFYGGGSNSTESRLVMWQQSYGLLLDNLFGVGFGNFSKYIHFSDSYKVMAYPHNIFLELGVEVGFISLALLLFIIVLSMKKYIKSMSRNTYISILFYLFLLFLLQAQVSADINGNRIFFTLLSIGLISSLLLNKNQYGDK